jgi:hypothetical protein
MLPSTSRARVLAAVLPGILAGTLGLSHSQPAQAQVVELCGPAAFPIWQIPFQVFDLFRDFSYGFARGPQQRLCPDQSPAYVLTTASGRWVTKQPDIFDNPRLLIASHDRFIVQVLRAKISSFGSTAYIGDKSGVFIPGGRLGVRAFDAAGNLLAEQISEPYSEGGSFTVNVRVPIARYEMFAVQPPTGRHYLVLSSVNFWNNITYIP